MNIPANTHQTVKHIANHRPRKWQSRLVSLGCGLGVIFAECWAWAQGLPQPVLTIAPFSTNAMLITITNPVVGVNYEIWKTPILGNLVDYPWTMAAVGTNGLSSYLIVKDIYPAEYYQAILDTNAIPLWEVANPTNQSLGILNVIIDSPTNGVTLQ